LFDVVKNGLPNFNDYDIIGFATFTDWFGIPQYFCALLDKIPVQPNKHAFVFTTYGGMSGKTLKIFAKLVEAKGFNLLSGHSLHMPESYPPSIARGMGFVNAPKAKDLKRFDAFITNLNSAAETIMAGNTPKKEKIRVGFINSFMPSFPRTKAKKDLGKQNVDKSLCDECGICKKVCPYGAIELKPKPVFDHDKCCGCWACYNHCPKKAIYTRKCRGKGHYPRPAKELVEKLRAIA